jgi:TetR/AcrR family transcriptional regulator, transcriptional repressor for nem operon
MPRTKAFEPEEALEKAMRLFWRKGYESASVQDLVEATGVNRFSLYETFGDKHQLFLAAIDRYAKTRAAGKLEKLEAGKDAREAIREYFDDLVDELCSEDGRRGCFLLNCAVESAPHDAKVAKRVGAHFKRLERAFYEALRKSKSKSQPEKDGRLKRVASYLTCCAQGLIVVAKVDPSRKTLGGVVKTALRQIG